MAAEKSVAEISCRFGKDRLEIVEYVNFMRNQCAIHVQEVAELNATLERFGLPKLPTREYVGTDHHLTPSEISDLAGAIDRVTPAIDRVTSELDRSMDDIPILQEDAISEDPGLLSEWVEYAMHHLPADPRDEEYEPAERAMLKHTATSPEIQDELSLSDRRLIITEALRRTRYIKFRNMNNAIHYVLDRFKAIKPIAKLVGPDAVVGVLRQGFILLMTAFDAVIFDLVRVKLRKDFFKLIGALGKNEKITFQDMAEAGNMEALQNEIIEEQLKTRYVKDLLVLLSNEWKVQCVEPGQKFERLLEMVLRRNIHVHNRGIVDERYLGEKKNLDKLKLGDVAYINEAYWQMANEICCVCVHNVGAWASS
jgi:hypothetical protein